MAPDHICGFYYTTHHPEYPPWMQWKRHYLPQVALKSHTTILGRISRTVLTQTFTNPDQTKAIKSARYTFPLFDGTSVVGFSCRIGDRVITGRVQEKEKAKADFNAAIERGEIAGLLEQLPSAADVFNTTIGNIPPGATLISEVTYLGELKHDAEVDGIRFTIPTAIAPRYGQYPGELVSAPESVSAHAQGGMEIVVDAVLDDGSYIKQLRSPTHPIAVSMGTTSASPDTEPTMTKASATLSLGTAELDKDFVLQVITKDAERPIAVLEAHPHIPQQRALMTTLVPKFSLPSIKPEIVFICDRSGSMRSGDKIFTAISALKVFLKSLPVGVKFNICSFGSRYSFLWPRSKAYTQETLDEATRHVEEFDANYGGTDIFAPLQATIENRYKDMELEVMLLTDGDVWGHERIFAYLNEQIHEKKEPIRVFTLGVGLDASSALVEGVARAGNGFSQAVGEKEKLDRKVVRMLKGALTPHVTDYSLEVKYAEGKEGVEADDDFEIIEKVTDGLRVDLKLEDKRSETHVDEKRKAPISLFNESIDLDAPDEKADSSDDADRYAHLPPIDTPAILQAPSPIPPLFPFNRTTVYLLLSPTSSAAGRTPSSVILRGTSAHGPLELEIPVRLASGNDGKGETIHQLAARKAVLELEEGRGWLAEAVDTTGAKLKDKMESRWEEMVEREAVRLGVQFQVGGKWCSFVALEEHNQNHKQDAEEMQQDWEYLDERPATASASGMVNNLSDKNKGLVRKLPFGSTISMRFPPTSVPLAQVVTNNFDALPGSQTLAGYQSSLMVLRQENRARRQMGHASALLTSSSSPPNQGVSLSGGARQPPSSASSPSPFALSVQCNSFSSQPPPPSPSRQPPMLRASQAPPFSAKMLPSSTWVDEMIAGDRRRLIVNVTSTAPQSRAFAQEASELGVEANKRKRKKMAGEAMRMSAHYTRALGDGNEETEEHDDRREGQSPLEKVVELQSFDGFWEWEERLLGVVQVGMEEVKTKGVAPGRVAATLLAVEYLRKVLGDEEESWELVVEKAEQWVRENGGDREEVARLREAVAGLVAAGRT